MTGCSCWQDAFDAGLAAGRSEDLPELAQQLAELLTPLLASAPVKLLTIEEAAEQLGFSRRWAYDLVMQGEIDRVEVPSRTGRTVNRRIEQSAIDAYVARNQRRGPVAYTREPTSPTYLADKANRTVGRAG